MPIYINGNDGEAFVWLVAPKFKATSGGNGLRYWTPPEATCPGEPFPLTEGVWLDDGSSIAATPAALSCFSFYFAGQPWDGMAP